MLKVAGIGTHLVLLDYAVRLERFSPSERDLLLIRASLDGLQRDGAGHWRRTKDWLIRDRYWFEETLMYSESIFSCIQYRTTIFSKRLHVWGGLFIYSVKRNMEALEQTKACLRILDLRTSPESKLPSALTAACVWNVPHETRCLNGPHCLVKITRT